MKKSETPLLERRLWLMGEKERLERLIRDSIDEGTLNLLRGDYRAVIGELATFYDDIKPEDN
jgi:hypothetical protein